MKVVFPQPEGPIIATISPGLKYVVMPVTKPVLLLAKDNKIFLPLMIWDFFSSFLLDFSASHTVLSISAYVQ